MVSPLSDILVKLSAGIPRGQSGLFALPIEVSARLTERQLELLLESLMEKEAMPPDDEPDPREYHRQWAKQNKIPTWVEPELWEAKNAANG